MRSRRCSTPAGSRRWRVSWRIPHAAASIASTPGWCAGSPFRLPSRPVGAHSPPPVRAVCSMTRWSRISITSTPRTAVRSPLSPPWQRAPRVLSEQLAPLPEPLACLLRARAEAPPALVAATSARALLDLAPLAAPRAPWPPWLAPHQVPAAERLVAIMRRYGGALLADAVGLGKSYVALAVALALGEPFALVVPAALAPAWRELLAGPGEGGVRGGTDGADVPRPRAGRDRAGGPAARRRAGRGDRGDPAARAAGRPGGPVPARPVVAPGVESAGISRQCPTLRGVPRSRARRGCRRSRPHATGVPALVPAGRWRGPAARAVAAAPRAGARAHPRAGPRRRAEPA